MVSRRPSLATSSKPWVPLLLAAVSGADRAFRLRTPSPKHRGGSAAKSKDQKPRQRLQLLIPQPRRSRSWGDLLLRSPPLTLLGLQRLASAGRAGAAADGFACRVRLHRVEEGSDKTNTLECRAASPASAGAPYLCLRNSGP